MHSADQVQVGISLAVAKLRSGAVLAVAVTLVGTSSLITPKSVSLIQSASSSPLASLSSSEYQSSWWAFRSPRMRESRARPSRSLEMGAT